VASKWMLIKKPKILLGVRLMVSGVLLWVLFGKLDRGWTSSVVPPFTRGTVLWLVGALGLTFFGVVLSALRWGAVLHALGQQPRIKRLLSHYLAGQFMANVLPSTIGGDALRVSRLSRDTGHSPTSFASVVLERMTGWLVLPVITLVALIVNPGLRHLGRATTVAETVAGITLALLLVVLGFATRPGAAALVHNEGWRRFTSAVRMGLRQLVHEPAAALRVVATGFAYQLVLVVSVLMAARALGMPSGVGPTAMLAFVPAVLIAQVLPITISGLGVREGLFALFLQPLGVPRAQAVALGLLLYLLNLLVSLLGAPAFAIGHRSDTPAGPTAA